MKTDVPCKQNFQVMIDCNFLKIYFFKFNIKTQNLYPQILVLLLAGSTLKYVCCLHTTNQKPSCYYNIVNHIEVSRCFFPPLWANNWQFILDHLPKFMHLQ